MARTLGDVLHLFLDEAEPGGPADAQPGEPPPSGARTAESAPRLITCIADADETLQAGISWNLAAAHASLGTPTTWLGAGPELAAAGPCLAAGLRQGRPGPSAETRLDAVAAARGAATWLQLAPELDVDRALLAHTLHFTTPGASSVAECLRRMEAVHARRGDGELSVLVHGAGSAHEGAAAFDQLAGAVRGRLGRSPRSLRLAGILADELEIYRSIVSRRPVCLQAPDSPAAGSLLSAARRLGAVTTWAVRRP